VVGCGFTRSTCPTAAAWTASTTASSWRGWHASPPTWPRRATWRRASPCADDRDVWDPARFVGATHTSDAERDALRAILDLGLEDVWRRHHEEGGVFSWWDYRAGDFHEGRGLRIDLVLLSHSLAGRSTSVLIDRDARKGKKPSDHAPVVVEIADS
jgi:exonuclease III